MNACLDVHYRSNSATAACLLFKDWDSGSEEAQFTQDIRPIAPYQPGHFYLRELPCLLKVLDQIEGQVDTIVIDGFVWLSGTTPGLGAHLYSALSCKTAVIGVAKNDFKGAHPKSKIYRGESTKPLFISSVGIDLNEAGHNIARMCGAFRIPTLLKRVDGLCRSVTED